MIVSRERIRQALMRAMHLSPARNVERAIDATAQALGVPREWMVEACEVVEEQT